jgi:hypothetical protein
MVIGISLLSLWLGALFQSSLYALFAVAGAYSTPILLPVLRAGMGDLAIYYTAWSVSFALYALRERNRQVYMLAMFLALVGFDLSWCMTGKTDWV